MSTNNARLDIRMPQETKDIIERAVSLTGRSISDFVRSSVEKEARKTVKDYEEMKLSKRASEAFAEVLINPPEPNDNIKRAAKHYEETIQQK